MNEVIRNGNSKLWICSASCEQNIDNQPTESKHKKNCIQTEKPIENGNIMKFFKSFFLCLHSMQCVTTIVGECIQYVFALSTQLILYSNDSDTLSTELSILFFGRFFFA